MKKMLVNFYITLYAFLAEIRALWVLCGDENAREFRLRGGAERLDELETERAEFDSTIQAYEADRQKAQLQIEALQTDNKELTNAKSRLMDERVALMAREGALQTQVDELVSRLQALTPAEVAAVVVRARAVSVHNARLDALAKMAYERCPMRAGSAFN